MFAFDLSQVALCAPEGITESGEPAGLPADLHEVIGSTGDQFRDWFTRLCLYLVHTGGETPGAGGSAARASGTRTDETVVIGTEYGNTAALARLQRDAASKGRLLSAQYFPNATSSSAAAFVNLSIGATGRNMTLNGGTLTPVLALWQALSALERGRSDVSRLLVGDVYSPEALRDADHDAPGVTCRSGVTHATLVRGHGLTAAFDFGTGLDAPGDARDDTPDNAPGARVEVIRDPGHPALTGDTVPAAAHDRNGAFATDAFLRLAGTLRAGERAVLTCRTATGRRAGVTVTRQKVTTDA
ncbi:hypothetical protein [Streptomyces sp. SM14]|nr:hypothetical protein [Streptomyces sp. SM14]